MPLQLSQSRLETPLPSRPESSGTPDQGDFCHPLSSFSTTGARHAKHTKHTAPLLLQQLLPLQLSQSRLETPLPSRPESSGTHDQGDFCHPLSSFSTTGARHAKHTKHTAPLLLQQLLPLQLSQSLLETPLPSRPESSGTTDQGDFCHPLSSFSTTGARHAKANQAYHSTFTPTIIAIATVSVPSWNTITIKARKLWNTDQGDFCHPLSSFSTTGARHAKHTKHTAPLLLQQLLPLQLSQSRLETPLPSRPESSGTRTKVIFVILSAPVAQLVQDMPSIPSIPLHFYSNNYCHCNCLSPVLKHHYHQGPKALEHGPRWFLSSSQLL